MARSPVRRKGSSACASLTGLRDHAMNKAAIGLVWALGLMGYVGEPAWAAGGLRADGLRCEYLGSPLGVDERLPRLSWIVSAPRRCERQTAYRVLVASSADRLAQDDGDLWDTGKVLSGQTCQI